MSNTENLNISISAYRVLYLLRLLSQHRSLSLEDLNQYFSRNPLIGKPFNAETITKYMNTLRKSGCVIPKASNKNEFTYQLLRNPFQRGLTEGELDIALKLFQALKQHPDATIHQTFGEFLRKVAWTIPDPQHQYLMDRINPEEALLVPESAHHLLQKYKVYCQEAQVLELTCLEDKLYLLEPERVEKQGQQLFLIGFDSKRQTMVKLNLKHILSCRQLPSKVHRTQTRVSITFEVYQRLAKTYRLYPGEKILSKHSERLKIRAQTDDPELLMRRLMKYGPLCQILSPDSIRQQVQKRLERMLDPLQAEPLV